MPKPDLRDTVRRHWYLLLILVVAIPAVGFFLVSEGTLLHKLTGAADAIQIVAALLAFAGVVVGVVQSYLQHGAAEATEAAAEQVREQMSSLRPTAHSAIPDLAGLQAMVAALEQRVDATTVSLSDAERETLVRAVADNLAGEAISKKVQDLATQVDHAVSTDRALELLERNSVVSLARLNSAIPEMTRRANLNLAIGIATTLVGVSVLAVSVFALPQPERQVDAVRYLLHFLPRLSLAILIEVFAYFFLRLYKDNLQSVTSLRTDMTNIEVSRTALASVIVSGDKEAVTRIAQLLICAPPSATAVPSVAEPFDAAKLKDVIEVLEKMATLARPKAG